MKMWTAAVLTLVLWCAAANVVEVVSFENATRLIRRDDETFLILVGDSTDVNTMRVSIIAEEVSRELEGFATVVYIDVRSSEVNFLLSSWNVQAIPTFKLLAPAKHQRPNHLGSIKQPIDFAEQTMTVEALKRFTLQGIPSKGLIDRIDNDVSLESLRNAAKASGHNVSILVTDKGASPLLYRRLSQKFVRRLGFLEVVKSKCPKLAKSLGGTRDTPSLHLFNFGTSEIHAYDGALNIRDISEWLAPFAISGKLRLLRQRGPICCNATREFLLIDNQAQ